MTDDPIIAATPEEAARSPLRKLPTVLKLLLEFGPLAVFFFANARADLFTATAAFMVSTAVALTVSFALVRRVPVMPLVSGAVVILFGGLTLAFHDELFIKLKPTIVNLLFASVLLGGLAFGRPLLARVFDDVLQLDDAGWRKLSFRWGLFFIFLAALNEVVWRSFPTDTWVSFKVFGVMPITLVFALLQTPLMQRHAVARPGETPAAPPARPENPAH